MESRTNSTTAQKNSTKKNMQARQEKEISKCFNFLTGALTATRPLMLLNSMGAHVSSALQNDSVTISIGKKETPQQCRAFDTNVASANFQHQRYEESQTSLLRTKVTTSSIPTHNLVAASMETEKENQHELQVLNRSDDKYCLHAKGANRKKTERSKHNMDIECKWCGNDGPEGGARAYVKGPDPMAIVLCANRLKSQDEVEEVLVHELIHVYDVHAGRDLR
mmetsp:Transcript_9418/g.13810  ORF Transcript_9418/g.13810 Transcript_9418/m.13810 type:complete len:222 (+) Transcript_9418:111-776(+)